jgi:hypothetical protein
LSITKESLWFSTEELEQMSRTAARHALESDVYFGVGLQKSAGAPSERGIADRVSGIPGLWFDFDIKGPAHAEKELPETPEAALSVLETISLKPS